jgi:hypothetical protein
LLQWDEEKQRERETDISEREGEAAFCGIGIEEGKLCIVAGKGKNWK